MKKILLFIIAVILFSCNNEDTDQQELFEISVSAIKDNSILINYKTRNLNSEKYLLIGKTENLSNDNFEIKIPIQDNENQIIVDQLLPNTKYYFKGIHNALSSNTISAVTKEVSFSVLLDKNLGINPESGYYLYLMHSEVDPTNSFIYLLTRQISQGGNVKKIILHKSDMAGNILWSTLIQDSNSPSVNVWHNGYKIQFLSDNKIAIITGKSNQKATIITKMEPTNGNMIWQKEYPLLDIDSYQSNSIFGYSYHNNLIKIITGPGDWQNNEEIFIDNNGSIISQKTIIKNQNNHAIMNGKYMNDGTVISIDKQDQYPNNGLWTYEGSIRKFNISGIQSETLWSKFYGDHGGDDSFENYIIKENHFIIDGFYGGNNGYTDKQHWLLKTDFNGNIIWQNKLLAKQYFIYHGLDFFSNSQNEYFSLMNEMFAPTFPQYNIITLTKFDNNGNFLWEWSDGKGANADSFTANRAFELSNGEYLITGQRTDNIGIGEIRLLKIKVN